MAYALVIEDVITTLGSLPNSARRLDTQEWVLGLPTADVELQQATGWFEVVEAEAPKNTDTLVYEQSFVLVDGIPTRVWTERPKTPEELTQEQEAANVTVIITDLNADMAAMQVILDDTDENINVNPAQRIKQMAQMLRHLGRLTTNDLSGVD